MHPDIDGTSVNLDAGLAVDYLNAYQQEKDSKTAHQGAKNRLLDAMKNAQYAKVGDTVVAERRDNGKGGVSLYKGRAATADDIRQQQEEGTP
jgi:hypothetical protein